MKQKKQQIGSLEQLTLEFLRRERRWPNMLCLPLKRKAKEAWLPETGFVIGDGIPEPKVYIGNIFELAATKQLPEETITYNSFEELVNDGWIVD